MLGSATVSAILRVAYDPPGTRQPDPRLKRFPEPWFRAQRAPGPASVRRSKVVVPFFTPVPLYPLGESIMASMKSGKKTVGNKPAAKKGAPKVAPPAAATATRKLALIGTVKSESADSMHLFLNGSEVSLKVDGDTATGKITLDVADSVTVKFKVGRLDGTDWTVEVDVGFPHDPAKILTQN